MGVRNEVLPAVSCGPVSQWGEVRNIRAATPTLRLSPQTAYFLEPTRLEMQRHFSSSSASSQGGGERAASSVQRRQTGEDAITDVIPPPPVSAVEGTSYMLVILAGIAIAGGAAYAVLSELFFASKEYEVFDLALARVQLDPRVNVRLGSPLTGYGSEARSRSARQHIRHREYWGPDNLEHLAAQFFVRGPNGSAAVHADMYKDDQKEWKFQYLYVEFNNGSRIVIEVPP
eukprot:CAMPEP_0196575568 /NCGR_PEP_ID=MMETSP1081-20130531/5018_1 /TAXON_ID=36882 /ORGANISM="Pyramimonas amylifera, Strain CCMP720" /LENGTH=229 /DNA_ID=CAMNT_0041893915 /DNA_START=205 /DNA_END=894 /DNA_ORIENTATION=-